MEITKEQGQKRNIVLLSVTESSEEAHETLDDENSKVVAFVKMNGDDSRMQAVAAVLEMALELDEGQTHRGVRKFLLDIFTASRDSGR